MIWRILLLITLISVIGSIFYLADSSHRKSQRVRSAVHQEIVENEQAQPDPDVLASNALVQVEQWVKQNPELYDEIIARFEEVADKFQDTRSAESAAQSARQYRETKQLEVGKVFEEIKNKIKPLEEKGEFEEALSLVEDYAGPFEEETLPERKAEVERLRIRAQEVVKQENPILKEIIAVLLTKGLKDASELAEKNKGELTSGGQSKEREQLLDSIERANRLGETVGNSFKIQNGQEVSVELKSGRVRLKIAGVENGAILYYSKVGGVRVTKRLALSQLSENELLERVGDDAAGLYLFRLATSAVKKDYASASNFLEKIPSPLREAVTVSLELSAASSVNDTAWNRLVMALFKSGISVSDIKDDPAALLDELKKSKRTAGMNLMLHAVAKDLYIQYRDSEWIKDQGVVKLINFMIGLKPDEEDASETPAEDPEAVTSGDAKNIDWRKEIDF